MNIYGCGSGITVRHPHFTPNNHLFPLNGLADSNGIMTKQRMFNFVFLYFCIFKFKILLEVEEIQLLGRKYMGYDQIKKVQFLFFIFYFKIQNPLGIRSTITWKIYGNDYRD